MNATGLGKDDLLHAYSFVHSCVSSENSKVFDRHLLSLGEFLGFEFVLYGYMHTTYTHRNDAVVVNLTNPEGWMKAYLKSQENNPLIDEVERQYALGHPLGYTVWDHYDWTLSSAQQHHIDRRREFGLEFGCSVFATSRKKNFSILLSLASKDRVPDERTEAIARMVIYPLMITKKRLIIQDLLASLTEKEKEVADQVMSGSTCKAIGRRIGVSENTVKFHLKNIYAKFRVNNRQQAIAVMFAADYLSF